jgi:predicted HD superfamily hydrolase involved in NAD metabolism
VAVAGTEARLREAVEALPRGLRDHVLRVEAESVRLAEVHRLDAGRARIAALGHDLVRDRRGDELLYLATRYELAPDAVERATPILIHGPVAARMLARDYGIDDPEVLDGVDCHTTARAGMTSLEKVLFLADKVEEEKLERYPEWREVRELAQSSLDGALRRFLDLHFEQAVRRGWHLHPRSLEARNEVLART